LGAFLISPPLSTADLSTRKISQGVAAKEIVSQDFYNAMERALTVKIHTV
jgi:hypothetical protein